MHRKCGLTLRSSGPPPAWHLAREPVQVIIRFAGQAPTRRGPLSSNVRPRMNNPRVFEACVPVLARYLATLERIVVSVEALQNEESSVVLRSQLAPEMLPFSKQVETAAFFALRTAYPLAGLPVPPYSESDPTLPALRARIKSTLGLLQALKPSQFVEAQGRTIYEKAGSAVIELPAERFLHEFALPNFFFHLNMAYAIARMHGCALGKADYDGFHVYKAEA